MSGIVTDNGIQGADYLPLDFVERMQGMLKEGAGDFFSSYGRKECPALRINPLKYDSRTAEVTEIESLAEVEWERNGRYYSEDMAFGKNPLHAAGVYYIQEASAMAPAAFLEARPGDIILDLCAAPGGKSTQIAGTMNGEGLLVSNEIVPKRAKILSENIERLGIKNALVVSSEPDRLAGRFMGYFDKILVDAPCSGEGMFRKHNEAAGEWSADNVRLCADRQGDILESAYRMLKYGGKLVYSTCTFAPLEDEVTVYRFLKAHPDMRLCDISEKKTESSHCKIAIACPDDIDEKDFRQFLEKSVNGIWRLWPHEIKGEGHFLAVFEKMIRNDSDSREKKIKIRGCTKERSGRSGLTKTMLNTLYDTMGAILSDDALMEIKEKEKRFCLIGDGLYLLPEIMPPIDGLKVMRAGLKLGDFLKNRFEVSHALALALSVKDVRRFRELNDEESRSYLKGMTLSGADSLSNGWVLVCHRGYSLGWGKCVNGVIKNHYPKGLRWV